MSSKKLPSSVRSLIVFAAVIGALAAGRALLGSGEVAETPAVFGASTSLQDALMASEKSGKPVFAMATADWCPPCQALKSGPLNNPELTEFIASNTEAVYIDVDANGKDATVLGVRSIPALFLINADGSTIASRNGYADADALLDWAREAIHVADPS